MLVMSIVNYGIILYHLCLDAITVNRLHIIQNNCVRLDCGLKKFVQMSTKKKLGLFKISNSMELFSLIFVQKLLSTSEPVSLKEKFIFLREIHSIRTRNMSILHFPQYSTNTMFQRCFHYQAIPLYTSCLYLVFVRMSEISIFKCPNLYTFIFNSIFMLVTLHRVETIRKNISG